MALRDEDALDAHGGGDLGVVVGVAHHHAVCGVQPAGVEIVQPGLHLAHAVNVRKAEQLGKVAFQTALGDLLDQVVPAACGEDDLLVSALLKLCQRLSGVVHGGIVRDGLVVPLDVALREERIGIAREVEAHAAVIILDGKSEDVPVAFGGEALGIIKLFQQRVQDVQ